MDSEKGDRLLQVGAQCPPPPPFGFWSPKIVGIRLTERSEKRVVCAVICAPLIKNMATGIDRLGRTVQATRAAVQFDTIWPITTHRFFATAQYCKTPSISTYVFSGLAMVQVLIFGGRTYFRGYDKAG